MRGPLMRTWSLGSPSTPRPRPACAGRSSCVTWSGPSWPPRSRSAWLPAVGPGGLGSRSTGACLGPRRRSLRSRRRPWRSSRRCYAGWVASPPRRPRESGPHASRLGSCPACTGVRCSPAACWLWGTDRRAAPPHPGHRTAAGRIAGARGPGPWRPQRRTSTDRPGTGVRRAGLDRCRAGRSRHRRGRPCHRRRRPCGRRGGGRGWPRPTHAAPGDAAGPLGRDPPPGPAAVGPGRRPDCRSCAASFSAPCNRERGAYPLQFAAVTLTLRSLLLKGGVSGSSVATWVGEHRGGRACRVDGARRGGCSLSWAAVQVAAGLADRGLAWCRHSLSRLWVPHSSFHSAVQACRPRRRNRRPPCCSLIWPKTGSTVSFRKA
jgi:hypothetical protein